MKVVKFILKFYNLKALPFQVFYVEHLRFNCEKCEWRQLNLQCSVHAVIYKLDHFLFISTPTQFKPIHNLRVISLCHFSFTLRIERKIKWKLRKSFAIFHITSTKWPVYSLKEYFNFFSFSSKKKGRKQFKHVDVNQSKVNNKWNVPENEQNMVLLYSGAIVNFNFHHTQYFV